MLGLSKIILSYWIAPDRTPAMGKGVAGMSSWGETGLEIEGCPAAVVPPKHHVPPHFWR